MCYNTLISDEKKFDANHYWGLKGSQGNQQNHHESQQVSYSATDSKRY